MKGNRESLNTGLKGLKMKLLQPKTVKYKIDKYFGQQRAVKNLALKQKSNC